MLAALASKAISARELLDMHLTRHSASHRKINAIIRTDVEAAQTQAEAIDNARARGEPLGPLAGLPMTVKDSFDVKGMPAHCGNPDWVDRSADCEDAEAVARLKRAGAIVWGKSNVPPMLQGWQSANPLYGATNNPYDLDRTPGGSSGGAAAALAAGVTPLELGSDIGGSLRIPAHFCGVVACKPTWGLIPQLGHIIRPPGLDFEIDLNVIGPMARNVGDLALLLRTLTDQPLDTAAARRRPLRVMIWTDGFAVANECRTAVEEAGIALRSAGAEVTYSKPPLNLEALLVAYRDLLLAALSYPGAPRPPVPTIARPSFLLQRAFGADPLSAAGYGLAFTGGTKQFARAQLIRDRLRERMHHYFSTYDLLVCPPAPGQAFLQDQSAPLHALHIDLDGRQMPMLHHLHWVSLASALHLPALVLPISHSDKGLPLGAQLIGNWGEEAVLLGVAEAIESVLGGFTPPNI